MIQFFVDRELRYLDTLTNRVYTQAEIDAKTEEIKELDRNKGFKDRMSGYYDKWYRYNRKDGGLAYDEGVKKAVATTGCAETVEIIECIN